MDERGISQAGKTVGSESSPPLELLLAEIESEASGTESSGASGLPGKKPEPGDLRYGAEQYIRFVLDDVHLAVPLISSLEVGRLPGITPLPNLPEWILGISNIRGEVVSIVDLNGFFGRGSFFGTPGGNMILLHNDAVKVGFRVDRLMGIVSLAGAESKVSANPFTQGDITPYLSGVVTTDESLLYFLDVEKLLTSEKMNSFRRL